MDCKDLEKKMPFSNLAKQMEKGKKEYKKCIEITERRLAETEKKKDLLRSMGLLDDF